MHNEDEVPAKANVPLTEPRAPNFSDSRRARTRSITHSNKAHGHPMSNLKHPEPFRNEAEPLNTPKSAGRNNLAFFKKNP